MLIVFSNFIAFQRVYQRIAYHYNFKYTQLYSHSTPSFEDDNVFEVKMLLKQNQELSHKTNDQKDINLPVNLPVNLPENLPVNLPKNLLVKSELDNAILQILAVNPKTTYTELSIQLNVAKETIRVHIKKLQENGLITRIGSDKNGYLTLTTLMRFVCNILIFNV